MAAKLKIGDVVRLKSGGPDMTVCEAKPEFHDGQVRCQWFGGRKLEYGYFPIESLVEVEVEDGKTK